MLLGDIEALSNAIDEFKTGLKDRDYPRIFELAAKGECEQGNQRDFMLSDKIKALRTVLGDTMSAEERLHFQQSGDHWQKSTIIRLKRIQDEDKRYKFENQMTACFDGIELVKGMLDANKILSARENALKNHVRAQELNQYREKLPRDLRKLATAPVRNKIIENFDAARTNIESKALSMLPACVPVAPSRATIAPCDKRPPTSAFKPAACANRGAQPASV